MRVLLIQQTCCIGPFLVAFGEDPEQHCSKAMASKSTKVHLNSLHSLKGNWNSEEMFQLGKSGGGSSCASRSVRKSSDCSSFTSPSTPGAGGAAGIPPGGLGL